MLAKSCVICPLLLMPTNITRPFGATSWHRSGTSLQGSRYRDHSLQVCAGFRPFPERCLESSSSIERSVGPALGTERYLGPRYEQKYSCITQDAYDERSLELDALLTSARIADRAPVVFFQRPLQRRVGR